LSFIDER
jgi:hypothetical protein